MLTLPAQVHIYLCVTPIDGRLGIDGLASLVQHQLGNDPFSGHLFVFRTRRGDRLKLLYWSEGGFILVYKRLERGRFAWPKVASLATATAVQIRASELTLLLDGLDLDRVHRRPRYTRPMPSTP